MGKFANVQVSTHWLDRWVYLIHFCAIGFLLAGCAYSNYAGAIRPPARFDHPFAGEMTIVEVEPEDIWEYCSKGVACAVEVTPTECRVIFNKAYAKWKSAIMRHETGHCNGWSGAHEQ
jgi:alpha-D-ribose 1-methylphosphonate 5-triphosphate synthase subunit PhnI